jgi:tetratricopeptide (TPR) repeat protein
MRVRNPRERGVARSLCWLLVCIFCLALRPFDAAGQVNHQFAARHLHSYLVAKTNWLTASTNVVRAWEFARATYDWAEFATNDTRRAQIAGEGIDAARRAIQTDPQCAPAHYYLGMNLGQLARTRLLGALKLVVEMEAHFKRAAELDPHFDFAGPDRNLGLLYREAPGWPASIGNRSKARHHLERAVELSPAYPANQLELLTAYLDWKETRPAEKLAPAVQKCLAAARDQFTGEAWEWSWDDWNRSWRIQQERLKKLSQ